MLESGVPLMISLNSASWRPKACPYASEPAFCLSSTEPSMSQNMRTANWDWVVVRFMAARDHLSDLTSLSHSCKRSFASLGGSFKKRAYIEPVDRPTILLFHSLSINAKNHFHCTATVNSRPSLATFCEI